MAAAKFNSRDDDHGASRPAPAIVAVIGICRACAKCRRCPTEVGQAGKGVAVSTG
jgi:hypothetical protein